MATTPGFLTDWPWKPLGNLKYLILAPSVVKATYDYVISNANDRDLTLLLIFPLLLIRALNNQFWISLSRYMTAKGKSRIVDKTIEFDQVDRERDWDDQIIFNGILYYVGYYSLTEARQMPLWRLDGVIIVILLHVGVVEFLYYWLHRALHHHFLYNRYHSHHHSSIVTEPITSVIHPFGEHIAYFTLFAIPLLTITLTKTGSIMAFAGYVTYIDVMNNMGHCNFELIPKVAFSIFPPLKYLMYTPSYHSLHHTQFRTNYSLFMPFYDYVYGTLDKSTDTLYENSLERTDESPNVVYLTHLTTPESIYHMRLGFASLASKPYTSPKWYLRMLWPVTIWSMIITWIYGQTFVVERNIFKKLKVQTWAVPKYKIQYFMEWQREAINDLIMEAILKAEGKGAKVLTLGLLNQGEELNRNGELFIKRNPKLKVKLVDGSSLAVAVVLNSIPKGTTQVLFRGTFNKVAYYLAVALCHKGIQVAISRPDDYQKLKLELELTGDQDNLILSRTYSQKVWLVGDGLSKEEELKASNGTLIIPYSHFPPNKVNKDCVYQTTPAMLTPKHLENVDSCENWLPRRVMSAWRIAGILHGLEGWNVNECGDKVFNVEKIWQASLQHGFTPITKSSN
ncbi:putative fatty acid hydroxylase [Helianthus annuus]|uniref:Fatty acid hydroxylase n=1 Tax=Helianthus annuus TaxID=4232 RepID=A0A251S134_HELAN|nr:very-long-chain aldehyde decarbonylase CER1 [Helianthus annuus]KAF5761340.1 putative fatty acid hydroxylase [Helianthus annuus]KAJ0439222.1 putative fatty acid hydroxylase [Helianthus annuus]KAJ0682621.1 putative fatty acid hydroxylase [Helianthus annuus]KAJ0822449.1 putative fatty acid hydroxylase [Helianthus annuus]